MPNPDLAFHLKESHTPLELRALLRQSEIKKSIRLRDLKAALDYSSHGTPTRHRLAAGQPTTSLLKVSLGTLALPSARARTSTSDSFINSSSTCSITSICTGHHTLQCQDHFYLFIESPYVGLLPIFNKLHFIINTSVEKYRNIHQYIHHKLFLHLKDAEVLSIIKRSVFLCVFE